MINSDFPEKIIKIRCKSDEEMSRMEDTLKGALSVELENLDMIFFLHQPDISSYERKWIIGFGENQDEVVKKNFLVGVYILRLLNQHPHLMNEVTMPNRRPNLNDYYKYLSQYSTLNHSTKSLLIGYSPNYTHINRKNTKKPHCLNILMQLICLEINHYGEFGVISQLCRAKHDCILANRDSHGLDICVRRMKFSRRGKALMKKYYPMDNWK